MSLYGYARVSTLDQDLSIQRAALEAAGCEVIRAETASGTRRDGRTELQALLDFLRAGDSLVVTRIDRLARSLKDLQDIVHELKARGVALKATEQPVDTGTAAGKAFLDMLGVFAEFETNLRRERQLEGIGAAKARGVYKGRKPSIDVVEVLRLRHEEKLARTRPRRRRARQAVGGARVGPARRPKMDSADHLARPAHPGRYGVVPTVPDPQSLRQTLGNRERGLVARQRRRQVALRLLRTSPILSCETEPA